MATNPEDIVDVPGYGDRCATFQEACDDARQFATDFSCEAWVARYSPEYDNIWKVRAPARALALFIERQRKAQIEEDLEYAEQEAEREHERQSEAWKDRYGTPWSAP